MEPEFYMNRWGEIRIVWQNPCGCHPFDFLVEVSRRDAWTVSLKNRYQFGAYIRRQKWMRLP